MSAKVASKRLLDAKKLDRADRGELETYWEHCRARSNEWIRRQVIEKNRIDILAGAVLGLDVKPFHVEMMRFQFRHPDSLQLVFRGAGKTTTCTVTKTIHYLLKNPNFRLLIVSKTANHAKGILKEVKNHFETNVRLTEIFGAYYDAKKMKKWDETEIEVLPRTIPAKEASVTTIGVGGQVVGKHYDAIISDDLVDEENSRTKLQRDKLRQWNYSSLDPTLEPPDDICEHRGEHHRLGTRYHYDDLWGHFVANELKEHHQIIRALSPDGQSPWPEKFSPEFFMSKRKKGGLIIFNAQYQNDTEAMKGEIFQFDDCQRIPSTSYPDVTGLRVYMGVDLAISEDEKADKFAIVVIGITPDRSAHYVLDFYEGQLRFTAQTSKIVEYAKRWDPIRIAIETNQYQEAQYQRLKDFEGEARGFDLRLKPVQTSKDKITRAWKLSSIFEDKKVYFKDIEQDLLVEHMVLFPNHRYKDLFDAFDLAILASKLKKRKRRDQEPGVI
jgi:predicted phage terminase large subunit-like protein